MKTLNRIRRHKKIRRKIFGNAERPRLSVFRSSQHIYAQVIDDEVGKTYVSFSDIKMDKLTKLQRAYEVGKEIAEKSLKLKIKEVVFDRGGYLYHGRIEQLAKGAREGGLKF